MKDTKVGWFLYKVKMLCKDKFYYLSYINPIFQDWYLYLQYFLNMVCNYIDTIKKFTNTGILQNKKKKIYSKFPLEMVSWKFNSKGTYVWMFKVLFFKFGFFAEKCNNII